MLEALQSLAPFGAIILFGWGVFQFKRTSELGFRRPFWEVQLQLYREVTSAAGTLVGSADESTWTTARETFWRLYFGPLCLVEDLAVEAAMCEFGAALEKTTFSKRNVETLSMLALALASASRKSLGTGFKLTLEDLTNNRGSVPRGSAG